MKVASSGVFDALGSTAGLIERVHGGDLLARETLVERCLPALKRWAHGRLPAWGRDLSETDDLVQVTLMRALRNLGEFAPERQGAFLAYLRQILVNALRDELRRNQRSVHEELGPEFVDPRTEGRAPALDRETQLAYEAALGSLEQRQQQAVVLRLEFGMTFPEVAAELGMPSANAARMLVSRGLLKIAQVMECPPSPPCS